MIETQRLLIKPLSHGQLLKFIKEDNSLEAELGLGRTSEAIPPELKEALEETILPNVADTAGNYLYATLWILIGKAENKMVGSLCLMGEPGDTGEIEIGYGTHEAFQGKGFMTEAVKGIVVWASGEQGVESVIASTEKANIASQAILRKNGFVQVKEAEGMIHWKRELKD